MRIKDITGERSFTILKDVVPYIERFGKNEYFRKIFSKDGMPTDPEKQTDVVVQRIAENLPNLISDSKNDLVAYFSLLEDVSPEEYLKNISMEKIMDGIMDMFSDEHFRVFFTPFLKKPTARG